MERLKTFTTPFFPSEPDKSADLWVRMEVDPKDYLSAEDLDGMEAECPECGFRTSNADAMWSHCCQ